MPSSVSALITGTGFVVTGGHQASCWRREFVIVHVCRELWLLLVFFRKPIDPRYSKPGTRNGSHIGVLAKSSVRSTQTRSLTHRPAPASPESWRKSAADVGASHRQSSTLWATIVRHRV